MRKKAQLKKGGICSKHPALEGTRLAQSGNCPACAAEYLKRPEARAAKKASYKRWYDKNTLKVRAKALAWRTANPDKSREYNYKTNGFTAALFREAVEKQGGCCAICRVDLSTLGKRGAHADHDHLTDEPRGVLCSKCNMGLGHFKDSPAILRAAIAYLKKPTL